MYWALANVKGTPWTYHNMTVRIHTHMSQSKPLPIPFKSPHQICVSTILKPELYPNVVVQNTSIGIPVFMVGEAHIRIPWYAHGALIEVSH